MNESRSGIALDSLQELLDAGKVGDTSLEQYETPPALARELMLKLPVRNPSTMLDPQCAGGNLLQIDSYWGSKYGIDIDNKIHSVGGVQLITGNCMKVFELIEELKPDLQFQVANANPPFGIRWKMASGDYIDSTLATFKFVTRHANCGFFIANANTIEKLELHRDTELVRVRVYERRKANLYWSNLRDDLEIGIIVWQRANRDVNIYTTPNDVSVFWSKAQNIINEEKLNRPEFNIYLERGMLKTYLSQRGIFKLKLTSEQVLKLHRLNDCHPLTLTTEKETRDLMRHLIDCGIYTIQPKAKEAIESALAEVSSLACPIMPVSDFETVAYTEEEDALKCNASFNGTLPNGFHAAFTKGKSYPLKTGSYKFTEEYTRNKIHFNEETFETYTLKHDCQLSGSDRYIEVKDDNGSIVRFMDRPNESMRFQQPEQALWTFFEKPVVKTVAESQKEQVERNHAILKTMEMVAGYTYYEGQLEYLSRLGVKDAALIAAETGCGKTLMAISVMAMKSPQRTLIIAPQGATRASKADDEDGSDDEEMSASQWVKELHKFAPYLQVWEIFSHEDYLTILALNNGELPCGVFISYYQAMFSNGAMESAPGSWDDEKLNAYMKSKMDMTPLPIEKDSMGDFDKRFWCDSIGKEVEGVRCIVKPSLSTLIGHLFDCVIVDESHIAKGMTSNVTHALIRMQPRMRYCLTATPVSNIVSDLFPIMGWLAVPEWYKGNRRNAAWPYAREDIGRFNSTFLTQERDLTQEDNNRRKDPKNRSKCVKESPIISSPARLLKLLKPNMAFISKEQCRADYIKPKIVDVRVPMGKEQTKLYCWFADRAHIAASNPLVRARKQVAYLRSICADPAGFRHGGEATPKVYSNMNPKVIAILELVRDILGRGEQVVIINSRIGLTSTIAMKLSECGVPIARIDSTQDAEQHAYQANLFKDGRARVLVMGIKCAAAYSFDDCENLIIGSLEYAYGHFNQACGRIDRVTNKCIKNIYCVLHKNSLEEVMFDAVSQKGDAANLCIRGKRIPRNFKPVDPSEILAEAINRIDSSGGTPEIECESKWSKIKFDNARS